jgi:hypothetical protein
MTIGRGEVKGRGEEIATIANETRRLDTGKAVVARSGKTQP